MGAAYTYTYGYSHIYVFILYLKDDDVRLESVSRPEPAPSEPESELESLVREHSIEMNKKRVRVSLNNFDHTSRQTNTAQYEYIHLNVDTNGNLLSKIFHTFYLY